MWCISIPNDHCAEDATIVGTPVEREICPSTRTLERERQDVLSSFLLPIEDVFFDTIMTDQFCDGNFHLFEDSHEYMLDSPIEDPIPTTLSMAANMVNIPQFTSYPTTFFEWVFHLHIILVFWITVIFWDSVLYWFEAPQCPLLARCICRSKLPPTISSFPSSWLILSHCILLLPTFYSRQRNAVPFPIPSLTTFMLYSIQQTTSTYHQVEQIDCLLHLNYETWGQLNTLYWNQLRAAVTTKWVKDQYIEKYLPFSDHDSDIFFDSYEHPPLPVEQIYYFDAILYQQVKTLDILSIHDICQPLGSVDCCENVTNTDLKVSPSLLGSAYLYQTATQQQETPGFNTQLFSFGITRQAVTFDTRASLGITHDKQDFDGPFTIPEGELWLGGMAQGLLNEGIGPVTWTFRNNDGSEVKIRSNCQLKGAIDQSKATVPFGKRNSRKVWRQWTGISLGIWQLSHPDRGIQQTKPLTNRICEYWRQDVDVPTHQSTSQLTLDLIWWKSKSHCWTETSPPLALSLRASKSSSCPVHTPELPVSGSEVHCSRQVQRFKPQVWYLPIRQKSLKTNTSIAIHHEWRNRLGALEAEHLGPGVRVSVNHFESRLLGHTFDS